METFKNIPFQPYMAVFKELEKITDIASMTKEERLRYDESIKIYRDNKAVLEFAKKKGREEGREEGIEQVAHNLKLAGVSVEIIAQTTGLTSEQIAAL
ncbi:hypothetical protein [Bacteroides sp.]